MVVDGSTLYVAWCGWSVIDEIDAATLAKTGSISAPNIDGTCDLAEAGGALWYTNTSNHLVSVTLGATPTTTDTGVLADGELATTPAHPDWLVSVFSEAYIRVYDVTDPTAPTQLGTTFAPQNADAINDITATPNGADVVVASGAPYELLALALPGLTADGVYPTQPYPNSVAVSPDGSLIAGGTMSYYDPDVWLFPAGNSTVRTKWDFGSTNDTLYPHGLGRPEDLRCGHRRRSRRVDHGPPRHVVVERARAASSRSSCTTTAVPWSACRSASASPSPGTPPISGTRPPGWRFRVTA